MHIIDVGQLTAQRGVKVPACSPVHVTPPSVLEKMLGFKASGYPELTAKQVAAVGQLTPLNG
jgi:hypothetical protein